MALIAVSAILRSEFAETMPLVRLVIVSIKELSCSGIASLNAVSAAGRSLAVPVSFITPSRF